MPDSPLDPSSFPTRRSSDLKVPCTANRVQNVRESEANNSQYCSPRLLWEDRQTADSSPSRLPICVHQYPSAIQFSFFLVSWELMEADKRILPSARDYSKVDL